MSRSLRARALPWVLPPLVCVVVFHLGLFCWFQQDDFAALRVEANSASDLWRLIVEPQAQGVIRPLSGSLFYLAFRRLFDLNAFPYRAFVFLIQIVNLLLLVAVARRLRASPVIAGVVWAVNIALVAPMTWTAAFNQILCSFFYLTAFLLFLRHVETGRWSWYVWQCVAFLVGFGALETMAVYPAVLLAYCVLAARPHAWKALVLSPPALLYAGVHLWLIRRDPSGPYVPHLDASVFGAVWDYVARALGRPAVPGAALLLAGSLLAAIIRTRNRAAMFGLAWFLLTLAPVLPLGEHRLDYYLTIPTIGLALTVGALFAGTPRAAAILWVGLYVIGSMLFVQRAVHAQYERSLAARRLVEGLRQIRALHLDSTFLLTGVTESLFYSVVYHGGLRVAGIDNVYLAPTNEGISNQRGFFPVDHYKLPARQTLAALATDRAVVYEVSGEVLQNITNRYKAMAGALLHPSLSRRVDIGDPRFADQLGGGWYEVQGHHRWMGRRAEVLVAGPRSPAERLRIEAIYDPHAGPRIVTIAVNGSVIGRAEIHDSRSTVHVFALPPLLVGADEIKVVLEADRTFRAPGDPRDLGVAFGIVELLN